MWSRRVGERMFGREREAGGSDDREWARRRRERARKKERETMLKDVCVCACV